MSGIIGTSIWRNAGAQRIKEELERIRSAINDNQGSMAQVVKHLGGIQETMRALNDNMHQWVTFQVSGAAQEGTTGLTPSSGDVSPHSHSLAATPSSALPAQSQPPLTPTSPHAAAGPVSPHAVSPNSPSGFSGGSGGGGGGAGEPVARSPSAGKKADVVKEKERSSGKHRKGGGGGGVMSSADDAKAGLSVDAPLARQPSTRSRTSEDAKRRAQQ